MPIANDAVAALADLQAHEHWVLDNRQEDEAGTACFNWASMGLREGALDPSLAVNYVNSESDAATLRTALDAVRRLPGNTPLTAQQKTDFVNLLTPFRQEYAPYNMQRCITLDNARLSEDANAEREEIMTRAITALSRAVLEMNGFTIADGESNYHVVLHFRRPERDKYAGVNLEHQWLQFRYAQPPNGRAATIQKIPSARIAIARKEVPNDPGAYITVHQPVTDFLAVQNTRIVRIIEEGHRRRIDQRVPSPAVGERLLVFAGDALT